MAENPQGELGSAVGALLVEECMNSATASAETMAENATQASSPHCSDETRAARRASKRRVVPDSVADHQQEIARRAKRAATEYYMNLGEAGGLGI